MSGVGVGEARPTGVVAGFNGGKPGGLDGQSSGCMQVVHKGCYTWKIGDAARSRSDATCWRGRVVRGVVIRAKGEMPKFGTCGFAQPL